MIWLAYCELFLAYGKTSMSRENEMKVLLERSSKVVGTKQVLRGLSEGTVGCVIVAEDADRILTDKVVGSAESAGVPVMRVPTMAWLGEACGIEVGAAAAAVMKRED